MKLQSKPGSGSFAAFLVFYGYVSFVVSIVCHVTSWQRRIILHSTFNCLLIHGCERFLPLSPGTCDVYTKQFVVQDTPRLSEVVMRTVLFLDGSIKVRSFFDSRFVDYFLMSVPMHYPGFLSLLSISYPSTLFSSTVWKQSGGGPISRKGSADVRIPRVYQGSDTCSVIGRLEGFSQSQNSCGKTCIIFENPYPTALATSFTNHRISLSDETLEILL